MRLDRGKELRPRRATGGLSGVSTWGERDTQWGSQVFSPSPLLNTVPTPLTSHTSLHPTHFPEMDAHKLLSITQEKSRTSPPGLLHPGATVPEDGTAMYPLDP